MKKLAVLLAAALLLAGCSKMELSSSSSPSQEQSSQPVESSSLPESGSPASEAKPAYNPDDEWQLRLVNAKNPLEAELTIELDEVQGYRVDARMAPQLRDMLAAAKEDGISLQIISGFRTFQKSAELYENEVQAWIALGYTREDALVEAAARVAPAGTSEHHTGLAVDIFTANWQGGFVDEFEEDAGGIWLHENCAKYGFVLRYPKDKTDITGIDYEPWHFRYVGAEHAAEIMSEKLCLEEYLAGK